MSQRPITITLAAALECVLGAVLIAEGAYVLGNTLLGRASDTAFAIPLTLLALVGGALLCFVAWGLFTLHGWARTPVVLTQLFALPVAWYLLENGRYLIGGVLGGVAGTALVVTLLPVSTAALFPEETHDTGR